MTFRSPGGASLEIDHPAAIAALTALAECWPEALTWRDLLHQVEARCSTRDEAAVRNVLFACLGADFASVHAASPRLVSRPGERPRASAVARYEITRRNIVTTLRHENLRIEDARGARLLQMLDGSRTRADLIRELSKGEDGNPDARTLGTQLETALAGLARAAVLEA